MAEQPLIVADPISSDGSEDSWILLDEMDEAMNEIDGVVNESSIEAAPETTVPEISIETAEVATETYQPLKIEEIHDNDDVNGNDFESKIETISSDLIDTCPSDDSSDSEHMYSSQPYDHVSLAPTTIDDGSTTDGSISMISDTEFQRYETKPKRKTIKGGNDPLDMLMNCRPIDMTVKNPRPTVQIRGRCAMPASVEELAMGKPCIIDVVITFLERLNNFFATTYLGQVFLLFVTIVSLTSYSIMYYRYTNIKLELKDLDQLYLKLDLHSMETDVKLANCEYRYNLELKNKNNEPNVPKSIVTEEDSKISATNLETKHYKLSDYIGNFEGENEDIHPTKSNRQFKTEATIDKTETISTFDRNDNDDFEEDLVIPSIRDDHGRTLWIGDDEPELPSKSWSDFQNYGDSGVAFEVFGSMLSDIINSGFVNCDIGTETTSEYECDSFCESDSKCNEVQKLFQDALVPHTPTKSIAASKSQNEEKTIEKTKTKWEKSEMKYKEHVEQYYSSEENFAEKKEKIRRDKKHRKDNDKENQNDNNKDRKESKGKKDKHVKDNHDSGKWNKAERKRGVANTYEYRYDD